MIKIKVGKQGLITADNFDNSVVKAIFPDGVVCELESDDSLRKYYEYSLKLRLKKGAYNEKDGSCESAQGGLLTQIPEYASGPLAIVFDDDDNPDTDNVEIATGNF